ncbi:hypothetical protein GGP41_001854 [Bipolaris sorokiniana]|uniref:Uncharacterized protein n=1 Tax=Cochliobolus sativus TaxID=45130 RepID=A0A8H5ZQE1_COCSA|nr:hypothetical protein GGP41_001854 [Bipolaris sorokiniana]
MAIFGFLILLIGSVFSASFVIVELALSFWWFRLDQAILDYRDACWFCLVHGGISCTHKNTICAGRKHPCPDQR